MKQFPFTALLRHLRRFGKFGIVMAAFIVPMVATKKEDLPDMDFLAENMEKKDPEIIEAFLNQMRKQDVIVGARMRDVIYDAIQYGYL